jgi:hypothetical protein
MAVMVLVGQSMGLQAQSPAVFTIEFKNDKLVPPRWELTLNPDGSGQFDADAGPMTPQPGRQIVAGAVHRPVQLSPEFTAHVFAVARARKFFAMECDGHMKVAFQGTKRLSYTGPEGTGACEYNYSKDKEIQDLGHALLGVENTLMFGARIEKLLQHDRLGLDLEMENLATAVHEGNAVEIGSIREILTRIASDEQVLERARRKARQLLTQAR